ncbi:MAG: ethanolamine ammonia-lyase reactivating factor EutA [Candidatus Accumulibacter sp.]|jgi:ethanolamine utilization protein EutA|nr:ethanolamine ammonia-lyase reactivating factor EutA [Accumulibacter sp.]
MAEKLLSVGIDLGTSTTQLVFSRLELENTASPTAIPRIQIVGKEIIYRGGIHPTPLIDRSRIDAGALRKIVEGEYQKAGIDPARISAGAVIITGETAHKENSEAVLRTLSGLAGNFVVAAAGSDLEAILAGRGAGTAAMSRARPGEHLANLDIGGGTTNIAVFRGGEPVDTSCLDIGGRRIVVDPATSRLIYVAPKIAALAERMRLDLKEGRAASPGDLARLCRRLAEIVAQAVGLLPGGGEDIELFVTAHPLKKAWPLRGLSFSGGVADCIRAGHDPRAPYPYGDIGSLLGHSIRECAAFSRVELLTPRETIRATVVGAGANSMEISGSTIAVGDAAGLPLKNVPILKLTEDDEARGYADFSARLAEKLAWFKEEGREKYQTAAIAFRGMHDPAFAAVKDLGAKLAAGLRDYLRANDTVIVVLERDMAKSLGNALMNALPGKKILSLDGIKAENGDYIDIGRPLANGRVVPVVIKTLVFDR